VTEFFPNRYYSGRFWTVRYFMGAGDENPGAMSAVLSGTSSIAANLTAEGVVTGGTGGSGGRVAPLWTMNVMVNRAIAAPIKANLGGWSSVTANMTATASLTASINGKSSLQADLTFIDWITLDNEFWLIAA